MLLVIGNAQQVIDNVEKFEIENRQITDHSSTTVLCNSYIWITRKIYW